MDINAGYKLWPMYHGQFHFVFLVTKYESYSVIRQK